MGTNILEEIPVVDLQSRNDFHTNAQDVNEIHNAFASIGFVYLTNHGIKQEKVDRVFRASRDFFELPQETKNKYPRLDVRTSFAQGYVAQNQEILEESSKLEIRESFDMVTPDFDYFPTEAPELKEALAELYPDVVSLTQRLLRAIGVALGQDPEFFIKNHEQIGGNGNFSLLRTIYYPELKDEDIQPGILRCGEHSDYGTFTLLFQDDIGGLEVLTKDKTWVQATPVPGSVLVNVGDLLQIWTNDEYPATMHRVLIPEAEIKRRTHRQSMAYFVHPDHDFEVLPLDGSRDKYREPVTSRVWTLKKLDATYRSI